MSDPEMVKRVTRRLFEILPTTTPRFDDLSEIGRANWLERGRKLIDAMREPTEAMISKATDCCFERPGADEGRYTVTVYLSDNEAAEVWSTMIDAALS